MELRKFQPLGETNPLIGRMCEGCHDLFRVKDVVTLVDLGPGDDTEERRKAREGKPYNAVALPIHWACATGIEE